jgi:hypothetical protein
VALGGLLVGLAGPGRGLAADAASFAIAGALRLSMRFPALPPVQAPNVLHDLREGWHEFISRRWLWIIVAQFAFLIAVSSAVINVVGPLVAHSHLGGARSWGFIVAAYSAGAIGGGSRVSSYDALGNFALAPAGTVVAGPLASALGTTAVLAAGGVLIVILPVLVLLVPEVRHLRSR